VSLVGWLRISIGRLRQGAACGGVDRRRTRRVACGHPVHRPSPTILRARGCAYRAGAGARSADTASRRGHPWRCGRCTRCRCGRTGPRSTYHMDHFHCHLADAHIRGLDRCQRGRHWTGPDARILRWSSFRPRFWRQGRRCGRRYGDVGGSAGSMQSMRPSVRWTTPCGTYASWHAQDSRSPGCRQHRRRRWAPRCACSPLRRAVDDALAAELVASDETAKRYTEQAEVATLDALGVASRLLPAGPPLPLVMIVGQLRSTGDRPHAGSRSG
jgi:hypothetical protein